MTVIDFDRDTAVVLLVASGCGAFGGIARYAGDKKEPLRHILVGMVAALGAMYFTQPSDAVRLIGGALLFGWGGEAVLASLQAKVKVDLAEKQAKEAKKEAADKSSKLDKAEADIDIAISALEKVTQPPDAAGKLSDLAMGNAGSKPSQPRPEVPAAAAMLDILKQHCQERRR